MRRLLLLLALIVTATQAVGQVSGNFALLSDYRFRGVSLSDGRPAAQADIVYDHSSGLYVGAIASTVNIPDTDSSLSAEGYAGFARPLSGRLSFDLGATYYVFPESDVRSSYDYSEVYGGLAFERVSATLHYADQYYGRDVHALYAEVNGSLPLNDRVALVAHVGFLRRFYSSSLGPGGPPDSQWDAKVGVVTKFFGLNWELSVVGTDVPEDRCTGGSRACAPGVLLAVSRGF